MAEELFESIRARNQAMVAELAEYTERLEELRVRFDRYFMGLDRIPPLKDRTDLERAFRTSMLVKSHKTEIKFRFKGLRARLATYGRRWDRIMRLIEEGKFKREKSALSSMGQQGQEPTRRDEDASVREVYKSWMEAQATVGKAPNVDFQRFKQKLQAQRAKHQEKFGWSGIDYAVKVKGGRVALVAKQRKDGEDGE